MTEKNSYDLGSGFFATDEWVRFCAEAWDIQPQRLVYQDEGKPNPKLECVIYRDRDKRIKNPPSHLYLGIRYFSSDSPNYTKLCRQWQTVLEQFTDTLSASKSDWLSFPPGVVDVRPLHWQDFATEVRYTYKLSLPLDLARCDPSVRQKIVKAQKNQYHCSRLGPEHIEAISRVLSHTEHRQNFSNKIDSSLLAKALSFIGPESFRCYGAWSQSNELVSVRIDLFRKGLVALDWLAGTMESHMTSGVTQMLIFYVLSDLASAGCTDFDFCGATMKHIGTAKASWGGQLMPFYTFRKRDLSYLIENNRAVGRKLIKRWLKQ